MLEREMEDLIAAHPDYFFPNYGLVLKGRQQAFHGIGRFDLLFVDRHGMNILMELKAVPARYEVIDQVAKYRDALIANGHANVLMWIVAPVIPLGLRDFFSHLGIEYSEITISEFKRIGTLTNYFPPSIDVALQPALLPKTAPAAPSNQAPAPFQSLAGKDEWGFGNGTQASFLVCALEKGGKTKEQIRSEYLQHFFPGMTFAEAKQKSGFGVFFSDCKRPVGTYSGSRSLLILEGADRTLSLDPVRTQTVKGAIRAGILIRLRGLHFRRNKAAFDAIIREFNLPTEI